MNKTVNINLAGTSFYIDEDAYGKLSRYLAAIRKSLKETEGSEEIMQDIEARIAELFSEKTGLSSRVVTLTELDEVIAVMGQPEDYEVDDEIFEDVPPSSKHQRSQPSAMHRQLFRDVDNKYIGGVSSGLGHYLGIDAIWIRLLWVLLVLAGMGSPILIYILLWILVPAALTTSDKLKMMGEPINISNIERKFKEGFDNVADRVKSVDYDKYGNKIKTGTSQFFDSLGEVIITLFKDFAKLIGVVIIIVSLITLISLVIGFFTVGSMGFWGNNEWAEHIAMVDTTNAPIWLWALLIVFAVGIPFFALFVLGLKLLITNLKSTSPTVKIVLIVVWALSIIGLAVLGIKQATEIAYDGNYIQEQELGIRPTDTLRIEMRSDTQFSHQIGRNSGLEIKYTRDDTRVIYSKDIRIEIKPSKEQTGRIIIEKTAGGNTILNAKKRAEAIEYHYSFDGNNLMLDGFFITDPANKFRDQQVEITVYVPEGTTVFSDKSVTSYYSFNSPLSEASTWDNNSHYYSILKNTVECLDCIPKEDVERPSSPEKNNSDFSRDSLISEPDRNWEKEVQDDFENSGTP